jgi:hypothetical protein
MNDSPELGEPIAPVAFSKPATAPPLPTHLRDPFRLRHARPAADPTSDQPSGRTAKAARPKQRHRKAPAMRRPFRGPRLADRIGFWRRLRSSVELLVVSVILGLLLAAIVASIVAGIVVAIQNALNA